MAAKNGLLTVFVRALYNKKTEMQLLRLHRDITRGTTKTISMKTREVVEYLNSRFLPVYQESYDNAGFLVGDLEREVTGVLVALDVTESVVDEAIETGANLIVSHHPLIFGDMKRITTGDEAGRLVTRLIENGIGAYAAHTNLDNLDWGVNGVLCRQLGLERCKVLRPVSGALRKLVTYVPNDKADEVREALFAAGAGGIGAYDCCSYNNVGTGTFRAGEGCNPYCGSIGELHREGETRIEVIYESRIEGRLIGKLLKAHPYEEPAYDCIPLANKLMSVGAGMVGELGEEMPMYDFLEMVKQVTGLKVLRCSELCLNKVKRVAVCGGSGSFLMGDAKSCGADVYLTGDLKYHDFQAAGGDIVLVDIGHYESERFAKELICSVISEKFSKFACRISEHDRGYIYYI